MGQDASVKALEKAKADLQKKLDATSVEADGIKEKYDACILKVKDLRRQIGALNYSIVALTGDAPPTGDGSGDLIQVITSILGQGPLTFAQLKRSVELQGLSPHGIRKALNGIAFTMVTGGKYVLRDSIYLDKAEE